MPASEWIYDITFNEGDNIGGARTMRFALVQDIMVLPPGIQWNVIGETQFFVGGKWWNVRCIEDSADFSERQKPAGKEPISFEIRFRADVASDNGTIRPTMDGVARFPIIAEVTDNNGRQRRIGELNNPAWLTVEYATGRGSTSLNGWAITVQWAHTDVCLFVNPQFVPITIPYDDGEDSASSGYTPGAGVEG